MKYDELQVYSGSDVIITKDIIVTQPTLRKIKEFGEQKYFNAVHTLTSAPADLKWQLWDYYNIDYTTIDDYDLFIFYISQAISSHKHLYNDIITNPNQHQKEIQTFTQEEIEDLNINPLQLIVKDIDFADFQLMEATLHEDNKQVILYNQERDITIDRLIYNQLVDVVRRIHGFKRNNEKPANETTKMDLIDDARDEAMAAKQKEFKSILRPLVSTMSIKSGNYGDDKIWDININRFFYDIKKVAKIQDAEHLLQGAYSGFASLKGIDKNRLDMFGEV